MPNICLASGKILYTTGDFMAIIAIRKERD
jgi:hypothetical protein